MMISDLSYLEETSEKDKVVGGQTVKQTFRERVSKQTPNGGSVVADTQITTIESDSPEVAASILKDFLEI